MPEEILVLNAGSSSLKFALFPVRADGGGRRARLRGSAQNIGGQLHLEIEARSGKHDLSRVLRGDEVNHETVLDRLLDWLSETGDGLNLAAAGHRVAHGGSRYDSPVALDDDTLEWLKGLTPLAPSHQAHNLAPVEALRKRWPELLQVACFDTAFHRTQPAVARRFALPRQYTEQGIVRYGFHGLSFEFIASALRGYDPAVADSRVVVAHLGHGASLCALHEGRSVATTMGLTVLDGLPMASRCGSLDPGVVLYLLRERQLSADEVQRLLYEQSGWYGVSGISDDMRDLLRSDAPAAKEAIDLFVYRTAREIGSLAVALGGLDALVFTAGVGEHAAAVRAGVCEPLAWLGLRLDTAANEAGGPCISAASSTIRVWVIPTDEESVIAGHTRRLIR